MWIWILVMLAVVVLDQVSKLLIEHFMELGESIPLIDGIFHLTYIHNDGAAFGMLSEHRWVFMVLSVVAIVALIVYLFWAKPKSRFVCASLAMIVGGGVGNMIDRVRLNYVIDFLDFCAFPELWKWIFNVADIAVCVGVGLYALYIVLDEVKADALADLNERFAALAESDYYATEWAL